MRKRVKKQEQRIFARVIGRESQYREYIGKLQISVYCSAANLWVCNGCKIVNIDDYLQAHSTDPVLYINLIGTI
jgi:hypothetical protein